MSFSVLFLISFLMLVSVSFSISFPSPLPMTNFLIGYLEKGKTGTEEYYTSLLNKLKTTIANKRPGMAKKKMLHHDNATIHSSYVV